MIKDLKKRFVLITMSLLSLVLIGIFSGISIISYQRLTNDSYRMLERFVEQPDTLFRPKIEKEKINAEVLPFTPVFSVEVDAHGNFLSGQTEGVRIDKEILDSAVESAFHNAEKRGKINSPALLFLKQALPNGNYRIAFADQSNHLVSFYALIRNLIILGLITLFIFWMISLYLAGLAIIPIETAWIRQKEFLADASHELKTPLTVILTNLGILYGNPEKSIASQFKWIENSQTEANRMKELVEQMLFLAKSDSVTLPQAKEIINFSDLVTESILTIESLAFESNLQIQDHIQSNIMFFGDRDQLKQLIHILLDNACKYSFPHTIITIMLSHLPRKLKLSVTNHGPIISPTNLPKIFDRFYRADESRGRETGGYGLGLSIAKSIVLAHQGKITVSSDNSNGTIFTVTLPK